MNATPLYRANDLRRIETAASDQPLMQRAGLAAADLAVTLANGRGAVLVLAGPGNNGGDAFEAAHLLRQRFFDTRVVFVGQANKLPKDAAAAYRRFVDGGGTTISSIPADTRFALIVDGLFGIGLKRGIAEPYAGLIAQANARAGHDACPLLALDCPSGLDADTGTRRSVCIVASHTITFIGGKPGLFTADGPDHCGEIHVATLGLTAHELAGAPGCTVDRVLFADRLKPRPRNSHKGSFGRAGILGGSAGMVGAALLAGRAALRLGSGLVNVGLLDENAPAIDIVQPELMLRTPDKLLASALDALACGPGMGRSEAARKALDAAIRSEYPLILDADALNLIAEDDERQIALAGRTAPSVLTPHPAEAARLLASDVASVQSDRIATACELANRFKAMVLLKGCGTVIADGADGSGSWFINTNGNPGLATAGSGDVLTGIITALLAQGWPAREATLAGAHLHADAADRLVAQGCGPIGLCAGELIDQARYNLNAWIVASR